MPVSLREESILALAMNMYMSHKFAYVPSYANPEIQDLHGHPDPEIQDLYGHPDPEFYMLHVLYCSRSK